MNSLNNNKSQQKCEIAVIGLACYYPGANSPSELWENILSRRQQFREMPDVRLPNKEYYDSNPEAPDKTYQNKAAVIDGYEFNWLERRIPKRTYDSTDIVHWLALDTALKALSDADYSKENILKDKTGVVLGNTLTGEFTRSNQMSLRWPFVRKVLKASLLKKGLSHHLSDLSSTMEYYYKSVFAPVTEDTLAGGLANTIAGRICNYLDVHGGGYIVDGACSSSLLAIITAANYLELNQMDMVIAGGVDISLDTFELIGFSKTKALTRNEMRVYDKQGQGFLPGEGCGMVVLKRMEDAVRDGDTIYASLLGWGISSDGKGGITAPSALGQSRALIRAYEKAGIDTKKINFIEGHGTGTTVGDKIELEGITIALNNKKKIPPRNCGVTSFKSIVGHTKAAAGVGAFIKTVMALDQRIMPPTAGLKDFNPIFEDKAKTIYPLIFGQIKNPSEILFAGVSAMGFGGINSHAVLCSGNAPSEKLKPSVSERKLMVSNQESEVFIFSSPSVDDLIAELELCSYMAKGISYAELADFAYYLNTNIKSEHKYRASIVAKTPFDLAEKIYTLIEKLKESGISEIKSIEGNTIVYGKKKENIKIAVAFPGQGSQKLNMTYKQKERHDWVEELYLKYDKILSDAGYANISDKIFRSTERITDLTDKLKWRDILKQTQNAQPAIILASLMWYKNLQQLGIGFDLAIGHSLGELAAFYAAGYINEEELVLFAGFRGDVMSNSGLGAMASLICTQKEAEELISEVDGYVTIANINAPQQTVVSGDEKAIDKLILVAENKHIGAAKLPVSAAFHSYLISKASDSIKASEILKPTASSKNKCKVLSTVTGEILDNEVNLREYFANQAVKQVDFVKAVQQLKDKCDIVIEVGPGRVLSGLIENITNEVKSFPVESYANDDVSYNVALANLYVYGVDLKIDVLYQNRLIRTFVPATERKFLVNPLERPLPVDIQSSDSNLDFNSVNSVFDFTGITGDAFSSYLSKRGEFLKEFIQVDMKHFHDSLVQPVFVEEKTKTNASGNIKLAVIEPGLANRSVSFASSLYSKLEEATGFPTDAFKDDMKLLDDLNLDSIKAGTLISSLSKEFSVAGKINASNYANANIKQIITAFEEVLPTETIEVPKPDQTSVEDAIIELVSEKTGFPSESINMGFRLLDDLNLDSIKAGSLLAEIAKHFKIQNKIQAAAFSNETISNIISTVKRLVEKTDKKPEPIVNEENVFSWVRDFEVELVSEPLVKPKNLEASYWTGKKVSLITDNEKLNGLSDKFKSKIEKYTPRFSCFSLKELFENQDSISGDTIIVDVKGGNDKEAIVQHTQMLAAIATNQNLIAADICFLQRGDGSFYRKSSKGSVNCISASAFAASLHLERPKCKIRTIEITENISIENISEIISDEMTTEKQFQTITYNNADRIVMKYNLVGENSVQSKFKIGGEDVVLITGGAKGITAECGLELALKYKNKTILLGSSPLSSGNKEIYDTLKRYSDNNLTARYYSCDISDSYSLEKIKIKAEKELGKVTMIIHGAGRNVPRLASMVSWEEAVKEISPKVMGTLNLINCFAENKLKQFTLFSSIIGITGMKGNAWYAFANETSDRLLRQIREKGTQTLSLAYSVWSEVGMGARMGSVETLSHMGIGAIPPNQGIEYFLKNIEFPANDQQVVVASRLGGLDTWERKNSELPKANRYLEEIGYFEPGVEIVAYAKLSAKTDLYLEDHNYNGSLLFPTVFGLESMAQAVAAVTGKTGFKNLVIENIQLTKPVVVPNQGENKIRIRAFVEESLNEKGKFIVKAGVATDQNNYLEDHFSAEFIIDSEIKTSKTKVPVNEPLLIEPKTDLYSWLLFQGKRFQLINKVYEMTDSHTLLSTRKISSDTSEECFSDSYQVPFILQSPLLRDTLLQSFQLILTKKLMLPVKIDRWTMHQINQPEEGGFIKCEYLDHKDKMYRTNVTFSDKKGEVIESIEGYYGQELGEKPEYPSPKEITEIAKNVKEKVDEALVNSREHFKSPLILIEKQPILLHKVDTNSRHQIENELLVKSSNLLLENGFKYKNNSLLYNKAGKPYFEGNDRCISVSHSNTWLMLTIGEEPQGCDIEYVQYRDKDIWNEMLGSDLAKLVANNKAENFNTYATRLWCIKESFFKAFSAEPVKLEEYSRNGKSIVFKTSLTDNELFINTISIEVYPGVEKIVSFIVEPLVKQEVHLQSKSEKVIVYENIADKLFDKSLNKFIHNFNITFKDCKGFFGKTYFLGYPAWMGSLREIALSPIKVELLKDLGSGQYGMVTNISSVQVFNEAEALDTITGTLSFTDKCDFDNSYIDFKYEWYKNNADGTRTLIAESYLSTTWVEIIDRGIVKKSPIPSYFRKYIDLYFDPSKNKEFENLTSGSSYLNSNDLGGLTYESGIIPRPQIILATEKYATGLYNGNTVGNLYYSNYYDWQSKTLDSLLYRLVPEIYHSNGKAGEYICLESSVNHLQEAMPFETIEVVMYLEKIYNNGLRFYFEYYSSSEEERRKLAYGSNTIIWASRKDAQAILEVKSNPSAVINYLKTFDKTITD
ncbi:MAG: SDR family NAD(P)-dependent oxidoreductase [Bacteroidales bacterium]|nr:SDR family NAD(P)-dependent oxidoreductase [Bacteroidales bacterium]MBN2818561.1 SDR family NAD(P)-dependent oxidoreductase [Bacteroidales bacterium]